MSNTLIKFDFLKEFKELQNLDSIEQKNILDYCGEIDTLVSKQIGIQFKNSGALHAAIVMSNIFLNSHKSIKIFAGCFNGEVSGVSIWGKSLEYCFTMNPDIKIDVILEEKPKDDSVGYLKIKELQKLRPESVSISLIDSGFKYKKSSFHFTVGDDNMYRFETNTKEFQAVCNFDDSETAKKLIKYFDIFQLGVIAI